MKDFLKQSAAVAVGGFVALVLLALVVALGIGSALKDRGDPLPERTTLVLDLGAPIADAPDAAAPRELLRRSLAGEARSPLRLWEVVEALHEAAADERVSDLLVRGPVGRRGLLSSFAALDELRTALVAFRASGKPLHFYSPDLGEAEYFVAAAADEVWMDPMGELRLDGFAAERVYYARALEELGVEVQVCRVGAYKSAVERWTRADMSAEDREQTEALLAVHEEAFQAAVAEGRGQGPTALRAAFAARGRLTAEEALERGFVDALVDDAELRARLAPEGEDAPTSTSLVAFARDVLPAGPGDGPLAVIYAEGAIVSGEGQGEVGGAALARLARELREDEDVQAVVLRVNSPGGGARASEVALRELERLAAEKPLVVSMGGVAASGGYWISCKATEVVASPLTLTGSIGVYGLLPNVEALLERIGVGVESVKTGPHADAASPLRRRGEAELALVQEEVERIYDTFLERVAAGRELEREAVDAVGRGRIWMGRAALERGLVDRLGGLETALARARELAGLDEEDGLRFPQAAPPSGLRGLLLEALEPPSGPPLAGELAPELTELARGVAQATRARGEVLARLPYELLVR